MYSGKVQKIYILYARGSSGLLRDKGGTQLNVYLPGKHYYELPESERTAVQNSGVSEEL